MTKKLYGGGFECLGKKIKCIKTKKKKATKKKSIWIKMQIEANLSYIYIVTNAVILTIVPMA